MESQINYLTQEVCKLKEENSIYVKNYRSRRDEFFSKLEDSLERAENREHGSRE